MKFMGRWFIFLLLVASLVVTLVTVGVQHLIDMQMTPIIEEQKLIQERNLAMVLEDAIKLRESTILGELTSNNNAGPVLQRYLKWDLALRSERHLSNAVIPKSLSEQLIFFGPRWLEKYRLFRKAEVDLSLLEILKEFDYWDIELDSPIQRIIQSGKFLHPAELPLPNNMEVIHLAKLELLKGLNDNKLKPSLLLVRHFAKILLNSQNLILITAGLSILHAEREAYEFHIRQLKRPAIASWSPVEKAEIKRIHRYVWALRGYFRIWSNNELMKRIVNETRVQFGFCAALNDAIPFAMSFKPYLLSKVPYELDFKENYSFFEGLGNTYKDKCRFGYVLHSIDHPPKSMTGGLSFFHLLPFFRRLVGLQLNLVPRSDFDAYEARL